MDKGSERVKSWRRTEKEPNQVARGFCKLVGMLLALGPVVSDFKPAPGKISTRVKYVSKEYWMAFKCLLS